MNIPELFQISSDAAFEAKALEVFSWQYEEVAVYRQFCDLLGRTPQTVNRLEAIPFLPIAFFKSHKVLAGKTEEVAQVFTSSGTTGAQTSRHYVSDLSVYEQSFLKGFAHFYGNIEDYVVLALLPSYLERSGSSLIYMAERLIRDSRHEESGFYLHELGELADTLNACESRGQKVLLIGVSFALLDLCEQYQLNLKHTIVMETGGMKGRRKELIREELHRQLCAGLGVKTVHSEYGMTELLSQAYSSGEGIFRCPPWMKVLVRETEDPLSLLPPGKTGGINVIDLANINSCAFIATQDLGKCYADGSFEVLGRFDHSDIRGCNLMVL